MVRFSGSEGHPRVPDTSCVNRGLTVRFRPPDRTHTDLIAASMPAFFAATPADFVLTAETMTPAR
ncbi:hypothetical protein OWR29_25860 [Actinoplanes sp. Pm04-4]|uniref:Uncharacterized protein n=1 Tax=Paractinoplanes pyxinae TaxID=2997416 RepID=A0ABT4B4L9_9ACTN|nr:hypothetical protein [Actinoplanes pyxinae]MCY1141437.1 hypothetical protein [Actinoplanes pyxinae]